MTKRYREPLEEVECADERPSAFAWRGQRYRVLQVLGHWREDPGWWRRADGAPIRIEQADLWRVEAAHGRGAGNGNGNGHGPAAGMGQRGVYELVRRGERWRLERVWD